MRYRWFFICAMILAGWLAASGRLANLNAQDTPVAKTTDAPPLIPPDFEGTIKLDVRDSVPDWMPFTPKAAKKGAPNVLFILYDDTGLAA